MDEREMLAFELEYAQLQRFNRVPVEFRPHFWSFKERAIARKTRVFRHDSRTYRAPLPKKLEEVS